MAPRKPRYGRRQFGRLENTRSRKKAILIVCEGKCTEPNYFKYLRRKLRIKQGLVEVCIIGKECGSAPISIVGYAKEECNKRKTSDQLPFDSVWCVFDVEAPHHQSLPQAIDQAIALKFNIALTNPAFEYWLLLHFEDTSRPLTPSRQAMKELHKHLPQFSKNLTDEVMKDIFPHTSIAIKRARQRFCNHSIAELVKTNPSTHVYKLVEELQYQSPDYQSVTTGKNPKSEF